MKKALNCLLVSVALSLAPILAFATIRNVPGTYATISAAVAAANSSDTILLANGTYQDNVNLGTKNLVIGSQFLLNGNVSHISATLVQRLPATTSPIFRVAGGQDSTTRFLGFTVLQGNSATGGGGFFIDGASPSLSWMVVQNNLAVLPVTGNPLSRLGGAVFLRNSNSTLDHCVFNNNRAERGGAICVYSNSAAKIYNCLFYNNVSNSSGAAIEVRGGAVAYVTVRNCTFANNTCNNTSGGRSLSCRSLGFTSNVANCVMWSTTGTGVQLSDTVGVLPLLVRNSDVQGGATGQSLATPPVWDPSNLDVDPLYIAPSTLDFRLNPASYCIEAGLNARVFWTQDLDQQTRIHDADGDGNAIVDMGAYESRTAFCKVNVLPTSLPMVQLTTRMCDGEITVCGDAARVRTRVRNNTAVAIDSLIFTPQLPPGVRYVPGTFSIDVTRPFAVQSATQPRFAVYFNTGLQPGREFTLTYEVQAGCDLIAPTQAGNPFVLPMKLRYRELPTGNYNLVTEVNPVSFNVRFADLVIMPPIQNQIKVANVGEVYVRTITVRNGGNGSLDQFEFRDSMDLGVTVLGIQKPSGNGGILGGNNVTALLTGADFLANTHPSTNFDNRFDPGESIVLRDTVRVQPTCDTAETKFTVQWGCDGHSCVAQGDFEFANTILGQGGPNFVVTELPGTFVPTNYCSGDTGRLKYRFFNNGPEQYPGAARAMNIQVIMLSSLGGVNLRNFKIGNVSLMGITTPPGPAGTHTINLGLLSVDPDGPGVGLEDLDGDGGYDDMLKGNSFDISADIVMNCPTGFSVCNLTFSGYLSSPRVVYQNQCYRPMGIRYGPTRQIAAGNSCVPTALGPTELGDGQVGTYTFTHHYPMSGLSNLDCNNRLAYLYVTLPAGLNYVSGSTMVNGFPTSAVQTGNLLKIYGNPLVTSNTVLNDDIYGQVFSLNLEMDCSAPGLQPVGVIRFQQVYQCDTTCACSYGAGCYNLNVKNLCVCDAPIVTTQNFNVERTTFGWIDDSRSTFVNRNTPGLRLDRLYECDSLQARAEGVVLASIADSVGVVLSYVSPGNDTLLLPGDAYIVIVDSLSGQSDTCVALPGIALVDSSPYTWEVRYMAGACGSPLDKGDKIILVANLAVKKTATLPDESNYEIPCFTATHFSIVAGQARTCDSRGKRMYVLKSEIETSMLTDFKHVYVKSCNTIERRLVFRADGGACETDEFPNEFRNLYQIMDTVRFYLPDGYEYVPGTSRYIRETTSPVSFPPLADPIINGNELTYVGSALFPSYGRWPLQDKVGHAGSDIYFYVKPTCAAGDYLVHDSAFFSYTNYDFAEDPACYDSILDIYRRGSLHHLHPFINVTGMLGNITTLGGQVTYGLQVCNDLLNPVTVDTVDLPYYRALNGWMAVSNASGYLDIVSVVDTTSGLPQNLPFISTLDPHGAPILLLNVDTLDVLTCKFLVVTANVEGCLPNDEDEVLMSAGWSCAPLNQMPDEGCIQDTTLLHFYQKESDLKATALSPVDNVFRACEPAQYTLTVSSSSLGTIYGVTVGVTLPAGMVMVPDSACFKYPLDSSFRFIADPDSLAPNHYLFVIDSIDSTILANGLPGVGSSPANAFDLKFQVTTDCDYVSGSVLSFTASGRTNCDSVLTFAFQTDPQYLEGAEPAYGMVLGLNTQGFRGCNNTATVEVSAYNDGPDAVGTTDSIEVVLPPNLSYVLGSFVAGTNAPSNPVPVIHAAPGGTALTWPLNPGLAPGSYSSFTLQVTSLGNLPCEQVPIILHTNFKDTVTCVLAPDSSCLVNGYSGQDTLGIPVVKDDLALEGFNAQVGCSTSVVSVNIHNNGGPVTANQTVDFYCDSDDSGTLSPGDAFMGSGTHAGGLAVNGSASIGLTLPGYCEHNMLAVLGTGSNCVCVDVVAMAVPTVDSTVQTVDAGFTYIGGCGSGAFTFHSDADSSATGHSWDFGDGGSSTLPNPTHVFTGTPPFTVTHVVTGLCRTDSASMVITFDNVPPSINCPPSLTLACGSDTSVAATGTASSEPGATLTHRDSIALGTCPVLLSIYRRWTAADSCGNETNCVQVIQLLDQLGPVLSGMPADVTVACDAVPVAATVTASDDCDGNLAVNFVESIVAGNCPGNYQVVRQWTATDACGNSSSHMQTITVQDLQAPVLQCPANVTVPNAPGTCGAPVSIVASATDNCGIANISYSVPSGTFPVGTTSVTVTATDGCSNSSSCVVIVTVVDTEAPTIVCPSSATYPCVGAIPPLNPSAATAQDNCAVVVTASQTTNGGSGCSTSPLQIVRTYTATDASGNTASCTQTISVATPASTGGSCTGCDASMVVTWNCLNPNCVTVTACKALSNVVLMDCNGTHYKFDNLAQGQSGTFCHPSGLPISTVWVKAGCFRSGDGPGYGRRFDHPCSPCPSSKVEEPVVGAAGLDIQLEGYPNPFGNEAQVRLMLSEGRHVVVKVYDLHGQEVGLLLDAEVGSGEWETMRLSGERLAAGVYTVVLTTDRGERRSLRITHAD